MNSKIVINSKPRYNFYKTYHKLPISYKKEKVNYTFVVELDKISKQIELFVFLKVHQVNSN